MLKKKIIITEIWHIKTFLQLGACLILSFTVHFLCQTILSNLLLCCPSHKSLKGKGKTCPQYNPSCDWFFNSEQFSEKKIIILWYNLILSKKYYFLYISAYPLPLNLILLVCKAVLHFLPWKLTGKLPALLHHSPSAAHHLSGVHCHNHGDVSRCFSVRWWLSRSMHQSQIHICMRTWSEFT